MENKNIVFIGTMIGYGIGIDTFITIATSILAVILFAVKNDTGGAEAPD
jgi:hypothetical protein